MNNIISTPGAPAFFSNKGLAVVISYGLVSRQVSALKSSKKILGKRINMSFEKNLNLPGFMMSKNLNW